MPYEIGDVVIEEDEMLETEVVYTVQSWPITEILQHVTESADFQEFDGSAPMWAYILASKSGDAWTPVLIERILDEGFTDPICIYRTVYGGYGIGNGHHRLVAAILLGLDEIPVFYSDTVEAYYPDASEGLDFSNAGLGDSDSADMLYKAFTKIYKKLIKQEQKALDEEANSR